MKKYNIGFVSTRLAGTDGVSLEARKWVTILKEDKHKCFYFAGELDHKKEHSCLSELAHFTHPRIEKIQNKSFGVTKRSEKTTREIHAITEQLKRELKEFIELYDINLLIIQNAVTIPMNIPLALAITELVAETGIKTIAHHHDFYWERTRFLYSAVADYLDMAFPPKMPSIHHVAINSIAGNEINYRRGVSVTIVPNVIDYDNPPPKPDEYSNNFRKDFGIEKNELLILQPTRVVQRKGIEHTIEFAKRLRKMNIKTKIVIPHSIKDEGSEYCEHIKEYAKLLKAELIFTEEYVKQFRSKHKDGRRIYSLEDVYQQSDLILYPSEYEGFGNAFLEAIYYKKPIVVQTYATYLTDIKPAGFKVIEFTNYLQNETVTDTLSLLSNKKELKSAVDYNYRIAREHFSYEILREKLRHIIVNLI